MEVISNTDLYVDVFWHHTAALPEVKVYENGVRLWLLVSGFGDSSSGWLCKIMYSLWFIIFQFTYQLLQKAIHRYKGIHYDSVRVSVLTLDNAVYYRRVLMSVFENDSMQM